MYFNIVNSQTQSIQTHNRHTKVLHYRHHHQPTNQPTNTLSHHPIHRPPPATHLTASCAVKVNTQRIISGATPLYLASQNNHLEVIEVLVKEGGADLNLPDSQQIAPIYVAAIEGNAEVRARPVG